MIKIQTLNKIAAIGTDNFDENKYLVADNVENPDAIMVRSASMLDMEFNSNLLAIARAGAGTNNVPVEKCVENGICVFNTPGANANAVKELVIAGILLSSRKVPEAMKWVQTLKGKGSEVGKLVEKGKGQFVGPEIYGKTLGVIGLGAIGVLVANAAISLGMKVIGYDPFLSVKAAWGLAPKAINAKNINEIYEDSDYITVHVPFNGETKGMINSETISMMKDDVRILNFARGELVNDADILSALDSGKINSYVTDFPSDTVLGAKGVIAIPHLGASTPESEDNCAYMAAIQLIDYIENGNITNSVNLPNAEMTASGVKVCVIHKNIPSIISYITTALGEANINIENMLNKSKKDYAYTMIDSKDDVNDDIISVLEKISGIIKVRIIR